MPQKKKKKSLLNRFLNVTEKAGNALPHPATLFAIFAVLVLLFSGLAHWLDWSAQHPDETKGIVEPVNLLSEWGLHQIFLKTVTNFTDFAPLGIVLVALLGIGIAESSGLISAIIRLLVLSSPRKLLTFVLVLAGVLSNIASNVGYVLLVPLAGVIFIAIKRHPIIGMAAAFAGVSGGFSANLVLGTIDPLLAGLSQEAARIYDPAYTVNPTANYYFMVVSTFFIAITGTWVTEKIVAPRFGEYTGEENETVEKLTKTEKKALLWATVTAIAILAIVFIGLIPENGFFRGKDGSILRSPAIKGVVTFIFILAGASGVVYGIVVNKFKNDADVMKGMSESMKTLSMYIVLVFFAAQFVAYFKWSNLGIIIAIKGANMIASLDLNLIFLAILFVILSATINIVMGSASAKWAIMAPVFIPIFMLLGYSPELTQVIYRIGDSITNVISPMMSFFALIIAFFQRYDKKAGIGTVIATMLPYSIAFFVIWVILLSLWITFGLPLGPGAGLYYEGAIQIEP